MYITYEEFCAISDEGIILSEEQFKRYELKARVKLDYYTQNRLENLETIPEKIKYLMYELITIIYSEDENKKDKGIVQSVSNDGYSVTYENVIDYNSMQEFISWIEDQNTKRNFPDFGDNCFIQTIINLQNTPSTSAIDKEIAKYMVQCRIIYEEI